MPHTDASEQLIVRFRPSARRLWLSALITIATGGAVGWFWGHLPDGIEHWMLLTAAGLIVFWLALMPLFVWSATSYRITTRRVVAKRGLITREEHELSHVAGYAIKVRRGIIQRLFGSGNITLSSGDESLVLRNVPHVQLVAEVINDQLENAQFAARRAAHGGVFFTPS